MEDHNHSLFSINVGVWDSVIRILVSVIVLAASAFVHSFAWQLAMGIGAYLMFATGVFSFCPLYTLFSFDTRNLGHSH